MSAADAYVLCATPRSGSTLLCYLLAATGRTGDPDSFLRHPDIWAAEWGLPPRTASDPASFARAYLHAMLKTGRAGTPMFGLRLMQENLTDLSALLDLVNPGLPNDRTRIAEAFGDVRYLHLTREDKVAQAVSRIKAEQTGLWHIAPDSTEVERLAPAQPPRYDAERIHRTVLSLEAQDVAWVRWFDDQGIRPLRIGYGALAADHVGTLVTICYALGVDAPDPGTVHPSVARLSDAVSAEWVRRYAQDRPRVG